jgi:hypothetical protein
VVVVVVLALLAFAGGLVALALLGVRLFRQVRHLGRVVATASEKVAEASASFDSASRLGESRRGGPS